MGDGYLSLKQSVNTKKQNGEENKIIRRKKKYMKGKMTKYLMKSSWNDYHENRYFLFSA